MWKLIFDVCVFAEETKRNLKIEKDRHVARGMFEAQM